MAIFAVGCGAGFSGDRTDAAAPVVKTLIEGGGPALPSRYGGIVSRARRARPQWRGASTN